MSADNQGQQIGILTDSKHIAAGLVFSAQLAESKSQRLILVSAANKIAELEMANQQRSDFKLGDKAVRLLQHCVGMYEPDEADCDHFEGMVPPTTEEAYQLLTALENGTVVLIPGGIPSFLTGEATVEKVSLANPDGDSEEDGAVERAPQGVSDIGAFFNQRVGGGTTNTAAEPVAQQAAQQQVSAGREPLESYAKRITAALHAEKDAAIAELGEDDKVGVATRILNRALASDILPKGINPEEIKDGLRDVHTRLGTLLQSGEIAKNAPGDPVGFHHFLGHVLEANQNAA